MNHKPSSELQRCAEAADRNVVRMSQYRIKRSAIRRQIESLTALLNHRARDCAWTIERLEQAISIGSQAISQGTPPEAAFNKAIAHSFIPEPAA